MLLRLAYFQAWILVLYKANWLVTLRSRDMINSEEVVNLKVVIEKLLYDKESLLRQVII